MAQAETLGVVGYRELLIAFAHADKETKKAGREIIKRAGEVVRSDAAARFASVDARSAAGYRTRVRQKGVIVEQSIRKTTGKRSDYGKLQMRRALLPALMSNVDATERAMEHALDEIAARFERTP